MLISSLSETVLRKPISVITSGNPTPNLFVKHWVKLTSAMAKTQADAIGGKFKVESQPGVGSTFSVIFASPLDDKTIPEPVLEQAS